LFKVNIFLNLFSIKQSIIMSGQQNKNTSKQHTSERKPGGSRKNISNYNDVVMVQGGGDGTYQTQFRAELMTISFHFGPVFPRHMGFMVGSKGSTLKEIMSQTGAKITTMPSDKMHSYPWFLVQGYYPQVQETVGRLNEVRAIAEEKIPYKHGQRQQPRPAKQDYQPPQDHEPLVDALLALQQATSYRPQSPSYSPQSPSYSPQSPTYNTESFVANVMSMNKEIANQRCPSEYSATTPSPCQEESSAPAAPKKKIVRKKRTNEE
jgi:hypothetical protein